MKIEVFAGESPRTAYAIAVGEAAAQLRSALSQMTASDPATGRVAAALRQLAKIEWVQGAVKDWSRAADAWLDRSGPAIKNQDSSQPFPKPAGPTRPRSTSSAPIPATTPAALAVLSPEAAALRDERNAAAIRETVARFEQQRAEAATAPISPNAEQPARPITEADAAAGWARAYAKAGLRQKDGRA